MRKILLLFFLIFTCSAFGQDDLFQQVADDIRLEAQSSEVCGMGPGDPAELMDKKINKMHAFYMHIVPWYVKGDSSYRLGLETELNGIENEFLEDDEVEVSSGSKTVPYLDYAESREEGIKWELILISEKYRCKHLIPLLESYIEDRCFDHLQTPGKSNASSCILDFNLYVHQLFALYNEPLGCQHVRYAYNRSAVYISLEKGSTSARCKRADYYEAFCNQLRQASPCAERDQNDFLKLGLMLVNEQMNLLDSTAYPASEALFLSIKNRLAELEKRYPKNRKVLYNTAVMYNNHAINLLKSVTGNASEKEIEKIEEKVLEYRMLFLEYMEKWSSITEVK